MALIHGHNSMVLTEATMVLIIQHYFDTAMFRPGSAPKATSVMRDGDLFKVGMAEAPAVVVMPTK